ncbi:MULTISPECIES: 2,3-butanediol dehydrogenase [Burkholderia]|uniref:2,3-butanediol dehydrogenase n=1 Tax=Burkholderia TaxID=32008 RepID=UPI0008417FC6|nr:MULTISPECIES: 2,3-butanediol dehydrogenase [unclassified Burkholderia]AOK28368.1 butanediol dehydrogenase [Burkholderia sp. Bp7605]
MKALQWHGARDLRVVDLDPAPVGPHEVRVAVVYCGICGSDVHEYADGPHAIPIDKPHPVSGRRAPLTIGHEFCGIVAEVGAQVNGLRLGERVAVEPEYRCRRCAYCAGGAYNLCESMGFAGLMGDGGMADYATVPAYMLHKLPDDITLEQAAVLEPAAVALHALRRSGLRAGNACAIFGLGPIGLLLVMLAKAHGASVVAAVDVAPQRIEAALRLGATLACDARDPGFVDTIRAAAGGLGVPISFEAAGLQATLDASMRVLRKGGRMVMVGLMHDARFDAFRAVNDELSITTSVGYRDVYPALFDLIRSGALDPAAIVTRTVPLARAVTDGFEALLHDKQQIKVLVAPGLDR